MAAFAGDVRSCAGTVANMSMDMDLAAGDPLAAFREYALDDHRWAPLLDAVALMDPVQLRLMFAAAALTLPQGWTARVVCVDGDWLIELVDETGLGDLFVALDADGRRWWGGGDEAHPSVEAAAATAIADALDVAASQTEEPSR